MNKKEDLIKELNITFKKRKWKLLPEDNLYFIKDRWAIIIIVDVLYIDRSYIPYEKHTDNYTIKQLDEYVVDLIKNICLKYDIKRIVFDDIKRCEGDSIYIK